MRTESSPTHRVIFDKAGNPRSLQFDDHYFCADNGLEESEAVFLKGNRLKERFQGLPIGESGVFTVGEAGFGTGLNFLSLRRLWNDSAPVDWTLRFISAEKFPLSREDFLTASNLWPSLADLSASLIHGYSSLDREAAGPHVISFKDERIELVLLFQDILKALQINADIFAGQRVDAWFLDGFAPAKNPEMWSPEVFDRIAKLSRPGTTFATFTAAGHIRRGLERAGFTVWREKGYGRKRHMLAGKYGGEHRT